MQKKKKNKPKQLYLPFANVICESRDSLKKLLYELGFHHSWGYFIHNDNGDTRIKVNTSIMFVSKQRNYFHAKDCIVFRNKPIEQVQSELKRYFNL
jgi:hypothetical protein